MIKTILKVGTGMMLITAVAAAAAGYVMGKNSSRMDIDYGGEGGEPEDEGGAEKRDDSGRRQAFKEVARAGKDMKNAWGRMQRGMKTIAKKTASDMADTAADVGQDDEDDDNS